MNIFQKLKNRHQENLQRMLDRRVNSMFQIKERGGELWFTFEGCFVCPCSMLSDAPVDAVEKMRSLYKSHLNDA